MSKAFDKIMAGMQDALADAKTQPTMLTRMARAIAKSSFSETAMCDRELESRVEAQWRSFLPEAKAALEAIRVPDPGVAAAGYEHMGDPCWPDDAARAFTAMIDAIIAG